MDRFSRFNPKATLLFFTLVVVLSIVVFNPSFLAISLVAAVLYKIRIDGKKGVKYVLTFVLPLLFVVTLFNFVFSHYGETVLFSIKNVCFTLQSLFYGFNQSLMLCSVLVWLSVYCTVISTEKFLSVFGRLAPNLALVFSMVISFIPRFRKNSEGIREARYLIDKNKNKLFQSINTFSALVTMTLEQSIETADSMLSRGFNGKRSVYSKYRFSYKDLSVIIFSLVCFCVLILFEMLGYFEFVFDPIIIKSKASPLCYLPFGIMAFLPLIIDFTEDIKWHFLKQKI